MFFKIGARLETLLKRDSNTGVILRNLRILQEHLFLQSASTLMAASNSKQCEPKKTHTLKVYAVEKEMVYLNGTSKVSVSR